MTVGVVLLAAGQSRRFGRDKRQAPLTQGNPEAATVLSQTLLHIEHSQLSCFVVLHPGDQKLATQLDELHVAWGMCPDAHLGMGHSLAFGVQATQHWQGWLIALADMPFVQPQSYQAIAQKLCDNHIVVPCFAAKNKEKRRGNPVAFSRSFAYQLMQCCGDCGARFLLQKYPEKVSELILNDPGIMMDIDYPNDL